MRSLLKLKTKESKKACFIRLLLLIYKAIHRKKILLIEDNFIADDNGTALFKYVRKYHKKQRVYFVMDKSNDNYKIPYKRVKKIGPVIFRKTRKFKFLVLASAYAATSIEDIYLVNPFSKNEKFYRDFLNKRIYVFLQHGVITNDLSREHNKYIFNTKGFVTSAKAEYDSIVDGNYFYSADEVWLTGLPRFDYLYHDEQKYIVIMPTWRKNLKPLLDSGSQTAIDLFVESSYYKFYYALLHNERLLACAEQYGYKIFLKSHPLMVKSDELLLSSDDFVKTLNESYRDTFAQSKLIITDYSSAIFDFLYLRKPIIYTHFDYDEFFSGSHAYDRGYIDYKKDGFGEVCPDLETTVNTIIEYIKNDCNLKEQYRDRIDNFFAYSDKNNCQRIYNKIIGE